MGLRAEGHANADFAGAKADGVVHDAVEADGGEEQADEPKTAKSVPARRGRKRAPRMWCSMVSSL